MRNEKRVLVTDTTLRDAHQSLLATRMRSHDMLEIAPVYARLLPELLSLECWGGATFDVAMRFLGECPWERLEALRERVPNILLQMLLRSANAVGYTNYPDNVVQYFVQARRGERHRSVPRVRFAERRRQHARGDRRGARHRRDLRSGDLLHRRSVRSGLHEVRPEVLRADGAANSRAAGAHVLGIKDMAGLCRPRAATTLVRTLREEVGLPIHFHTHDTSGISAASVLAAVDAGCDAVDAAMDSMSGLTSQPNLGSIVEALRHDCARDRARSGTHPRDFALLRTGAQLLHRVRKRHPLRRVGGVRARHAGRPVHQPARAGARSRARRSLARSGAGVCATSTRCSATSSR